MSSVTYTDLVLVQVRSTEAFLLPSFFDLPSGTRSVRDPEMTQSQQTIEINHGQQLTSDPQDQPGEMHDQQASKEKQPKQERARRPRRPSATPQPETPRLRLHIKETEKGQHLSGASKHRMVLHQKSLLETPKANKQKPSGSPIKEEATMHRTTPVPVSSPTNATQHTFQQFDGTMPFRPTSEVPGQLLYHPAYGWGWVPGFSFPNQDQGIANPKDIFRSPSVPTEGSQQPAPQIFQSPYDLPVGQSSLGSPFEPRVNGRLRQTAATLDHVAPLPVGQVGATLISQSNSAGTSGHPGDAEDASDRDNSDRTRDQSTPLAAVSHELTHLDVPTAGKCVDAAGWPLMHAGQPGIPQSMTTDEVLAGYLASLRGQLQIASASTGLSEEELINQLRSPEGRVVQDNFALYKSYFLTRVEAELRRLPHEVRPDDITDVPDDVIRKAFGLFKDEVPDSTNFLANFLTDWSSIYCIASSRDFSNRPEQFRRYAAKLEAIFESASLLLGFESASCTVGSRIHEDQALAVTVCSPMVPDFFPGRLHVSERDLLGHLRAHAYDYVSRKTPPDIPPSQFSPREQSRESTSGTSSNPAVDKGKGKAVTEPEEKIQNFAVAPLEVPVIQVPEEEQFGDAKQKKRRSKDKDQARIEELKKELFHLTKNCNIKQLLSGNIQLTKLPRILAQNGWVLENWPEDVPFACDCKTGKGVAGLPVQDQISLLRSLKDPAFPLRVVRRSENPIPPSEPAIIGVPPPHDSQYTHGRRRFLDPQETCDRKGPPRLTSQYIGPSSIVEGEAELRETATPLKTNETNPRKRPGTAQESNTAEGNTTKKVKVEKRAAFQADSHSDDGFSSGSDSVYDGSQNKVAMDDIASSAEPDMSNHRGPGTNLASAIPENVKGSSSQSGRQIRDARVLPDHPCVFEASPGRGAGEIQNHMVTLASLEDKKFCPSEVESSHSGFWLPFPQAGQYNMGFPPGSQMMPFSIPFAPAPHPGNQGSNLQHSGPAIPPFVPYQNQIAPSRPSNNQYLRAPGSHVLPPPFVPNQSAAYTNDPRNQYTRGYHKDHIAHDVSKKPLPGSQD